MNTILLINPLAAILWLFHIGINIALFFLLIRWIQTWRQTTFLCGLEKAGRPLTDQILSAARHGMQRLFPEKRFSERGLLGISTLALSLIGLILSAWIPAG